MKRAPLMERYAKDLLRDPFYAWLERRNNWLQFSLISWIAYFVAGFGIATLTGASVRMRRNSASACSSGAPS